MLIDLEKADGPLVLAADVCVVGAGAAGLTVARRLLAGGRAVVLLESGGADYEARTAALNAGESIGVAYPDLQGSRLRLFGGTTAIWGGRCAELDPIDFQRRDWVSGSGWPFDKAALRRWYDEAWTSLGLAAPEPATIFGGSDVETRLWQFDGQADRFTLPRCRDVVEHPRCTVVLHATATSLDAQTPGRAVQTVTARSLHGHGLTVTTRSVVLALGGLETPRLLLLSGLGNAHDQVGRGFMEHPHGRGGRVVTDRPWTLLRSLSGRRRADGVRIAPVLGLSEAVQAREGVLNSAISLAARQPSGSREGIGAAVYRQARHGLQPKRQVRWLWRAAKGAATDLREMTDPLWPWLNVRRGARELTLVLRAEQAPDPRSRILLGDERDALGLRKLKLDWRLSDLDRHSARVLVETVGRALERQGLGSIEPAAWLTELGGGWSFDALASAHPVGGFHHMGGARMADDPRRGVTDGWGKVHGVGNLWVVGSSVFPTGGWANPTLTVLALSLRTADRILEDR